MSIIKSFTGASGAATYVPRVFGDLLFEELQIYDEAQTDLAAHYHAIEDIIDRIEHGELDAQGDLADTYRLFMDAVDQSALFLGFCMKNIAHLPKVLKWIDADIQAVLTHYPTMTLADPAHLEREMALIRNRTLEVSQMTMNMISRHARAYLGMEGVNTDFLTLKNQNDQNFNDWIERRFLEIYSLPLNVYTRSPGMEAQIRGQLYSRPYCAALIRKIRSGQLQEQFPGLSLDGDKPKVAQLRRVHEQVAGHVSAFTPSKEAHVIHLDSAEPPQGAPRPRARARRPVGYRQTGRAPR